MPPLLFSVLNYTLLPEGEQVQVEKPLMLAQYLGSQHLTAGLPTGVRVSDDGASSQMKLPGHS